MRRTRSAHTPRPRAATSPSRPISYDLHQGRPARRLGRPPPSSSSTVVHQQIQWRRHDRSIGATANVPVIWFRGAGRDETVRQITKPFWRTREDGLTHWPSSIARSDHTRTDTTMLSEKFFLVLESLIRTQGQIHADGAPRVVSNSPHVPVKLPQHQRNQN